MRCSSVRLVRYGPPIIGYVRMRDHVRAYVSCTWLIVAIWKEAPARHKITRTPPCVLRKNVPSFDRSIDTTLLESTKSDKTWSVSYGLAHPDRTVPHRTVPNRTYSSALSGSLVVRSWFALGSLVVLLRYGTVTVRYFNFF